MVHSVSVAVVAVGDIIPHQRGGGEAGVEEDRQEERGGAGGYHHRAGRGTSSANLQAVVGSSVQLAVVSSFLLHFLTG